MNGYVTPEDPTTVAIVRAPDGTAHDTAYTWEAGQAYASAGYRVEAVTGDAHLTRDETQALYDAERARFIDCYGRTAPFDYNEDEDR